jgi:hypothetical protein
MSSCFTCAHFSGLRYLPYCKKVLLNPAQTITRDNHKTYITRPTYEWCYNLAYEGGACGLDAKLYEPYEHGINLKDPEPIMKFGECTPKYKEFLASIDHIDHTKSKNII